MILRRLAKHVKHQNWFVVVLDLLIVVVGVFIGLQVSNWNDAREASHSREYYLQRLDIDLTRSLEIMESQSEQSAESSEIIERFTDALNSPDYPDEDLVAVTHEYLGTATIITGLKMIWTTFDDLSSTGNVAVLNNPRLVEALTLLRTTYDHSEIGERVNTDWIMPFETQLATDFDWMRYDPNASHLFPERPIEDLAANIRANADLLRRHAALHYFYNSSVMSVIEGLSAGIEQSRELVRADAGAGYSPGG